MNICREFVHIRLLVTFDGNLLFVDLVELSDSKQEHLPPSMYLTIVQFRKSFVQRCLHVLPPQMFFV